MSTSICSFSLPDDQVFKLFHLLETRHQKQLMMLYEMLKKDVVEYSWLRPENDEVPLNESLMFVVSRHELRIL
ncbi:hypothetical protein KIN20_013643 [Parelaphostrongylus tenuis]|uniref:Uncharacterized protein n=1 Tax=Parelaphostrongylus tenuis TaxID=148309 RepID=A0AAD5MH02_PARTN|nr:hypothetical protein KIN20_013643 [Parelaphostrongylus tenuis]